MHNRHIHNWKIWQEYTSAQSLYFSFLHPLKNLPLMKDFGLYQNLLRNCFPRKYVTLSERLLLRQINLHDLHGEDYSTDIKIFKSKIEDIPLNDAKKLATEVRKILDVPLNEQFGWKTEDDALKQWRNRLENVGIWIFKDAFQSEDYCGFCLYDKHFPLIYLNNSVPKQRQIFTIFHEVGHLLIAKGGVDFRNNAEHGLQGIYRQEEVFCNAFAGAFLVPDSDFPIAAVPSEKQISDCAKKYNVSREVILRKCLDRNLVTQEFYEEKVREWRENWKARKQSTTEEGGGGNYYATQKAYLGDKYLTLLFKQYYQQRIDESKLADYLGVKVGSIQTLEGYMLGGNG